MNKPIKLTDLEIDALRKAFEFCYKNSHYNPALQRAMDKVFRSQNYNAQQSVQRTGLTVRQNQKLVGTPRR